MVNDRKSKSPFEKEIYFFKYLENMNLCYLKEFMKLLKTTNSPNRYNFSYIEKNANLMNNLSILKNITLEAIPKIKGNPNDFSLDSHIKESGNFALYDLFSQIKNIDAHPSTLDLEKQKIVNITKSLLTRSDYLFIDSAEYNLSKKNLRIFKMALMTHFEKHNPTIILTSPCLGLWEHTASKIILTSNEKDKSYLIKNLRPKKLIEINRPKTNEKSGQLEFYTLKMLNKRSA